LKTTTGFLTVFIFLSIYSFGQETSTLDSLNGFKEFKLGKTLKVDSNKTSCSDFFKGSEAPTTPTEKGVEYGYVCFSPKNASISGLKVLNIHVSTFNGKIFRVIVNTELSEKMPIIVKELFGPSVECDNFVDSDPIMRRSEMCTWKSKEVILKHCSYLPLKGHTMNKLSEPWMKNGFNSLTFISKSMLEMINSESKKSFSQARKDF